MDMQRQHALEECEAGDLSGYHAVCARVVESLRSSDRWFQAFHHDEVRTSEEAAQTRPGYTLHQGAKAIIVTLKRKAADADKPAHVMLVFPADEKFNSKQVKKALNVKDVRFAQPDVVSEITGGVQPGGVPPFGNLFGIPVYVAPELMQLDRIVFNAGDRRFSLAVNVSDVKELVNPSTLPMLT